MIFLLFRTTKSRRPPETLNRRKIDRCGQWVRYTRFPKMFEIRSFAISRIHECSGRSFRTELFKRARIHGARRGQRESRETTETRRAEGVSNDNNSIIDVRTSSRYRTDRARKPPDGDARHYHAPPAPPRARSYSGRHPL